MGAGEGACQERWDVSPESPVTEHRKKMGLHNMCIRKQLCFFNNSLEVKCRLLGKMEPLGTTDTRSFHPLWILH